MASRTRTRYTSPVLATRMSTPRGLSGPKPSTTKRIVRAACAGRIEMVERRPAAGSPMPCLLSTSHVSGSTRPALDSGQKPARGWFLDVLTRIDPAHAWIPALRAGALPDRSRIAAVGPSPARRPLGSMIWPGELNCRNLARAADCWHNAHAQHCRLHRVVSLAHQPSLDGHNAGARHPMGGSDVIMNEIVLKRREAMSSYLHASSRNSL